MATSRDYLHGVRRPSPGLDTEHGFLEFIQRNQHQRKLCDKPLLLNGTMAVDWDAVDVTSYVKEAQPYIKALIEDPSSIPARLMSDVVSTIINRGYEDPGYYSVAATICSSVIAKERDQQADLCIPKYTFRISLLDACQILLRDWMKMRETSMQYWLCYCRFLGLLYMKTSSSGSSLSALGGMVTTLMTHLTSDTCTQNFEEVDLLCTLFHDCAASLTEDNAVVMDDVMMSIRDVFLSSMTDQATQGLLLPLIELYASNFHLSHQAKNYYFQM